MLMKGPAEHGRHRSESRVPFIDHKLVESLCAILAVEGAVLVGKYLLRGHGRAGCPPTFFTDLKWGFPKR